ncbi:putative HIT-type Zinc finger family protein [Hibiscus syriacus]|uniref:Putative HIT-type Zinc finger family protein n=1 Tax=Hibiscus syriacus TaxID=106335 RepID=A0A6A3CJB3_HIBSY|nr:putative HIT-type Zinc finger family protein [Hibiscus syriacus]KAE8729246.1 putative HIT-type Zinc finger family protein [Hibiscus syriacus]
MVPSGSEGDLHQLMDQRKRKRMKSNRESARSSRMRKQKHAENSVLRAQMMELSQRLESLNQILHCLNNWVYESEGFETSDESFTTNPFNIPHLNQPIMASADMMFEY